MFPDESELGAINHSYRVPKCYVNSLNLPLRSIQIRFRVTSLERMRFYHNLCNKCSVKLYFLFKIIQELFLNVFVTK